MSPREYQKQGKKIGIRKPFLKSKSQTEIQGSGFYQVRLEYRESFTLTGLPTTLQGLLADVPDFLDKVPQVWQELDDYLTQMSSSPKSKYGVIDTRNDTESLIYWAGIIDDEHLSSELISLSKKVSKIFIPAQEYAVLPYVGPSSGLAKSVEWLLSEWLRQSRSQIRRGTVSG
jgi:AraC family transcriptional regulator